MIDRSRRGRRFWTLYVPSGLVAFWQCCASSCYAIEPGIYEYAKHPDKYAEISKIQKEADEELFLYQDKFGLVKHVPKPFRWFAREEIKELLAQEKQKDVLVISFGIEPLPWSYYCRQIERLKKSVVDMEPLVKTLGYKRVLFMTVGVDSNVKAVHLLKDLDLTDET